MIVLAGAELVLPDRVVSPGTVVVENDRIVDVRPGGAPTLHGHYVVPGFIDVHVHGIGGVDSLDLLPDDSAVSRIAAALPRCGVAAFCPTTVACGPRDLARVLDAVRRARLSPAARAARVLPAHLESNFLNPDYRGAQPLACLRRPPAAPGGAAPGGPEHGGQPFSASDVLCVIEENGPEIGIVTLAPELDGGLELTGRLRALGHRVSIGHSGATYEQALGAIAAGASQATHLFNRMPPLLHRAPGLVGAMLQAEEIAAEVICDGFHVHPVLVRTALAAKRPSRIMAVTDGTAASGLPAGRRASLGGLAISAGEGAAFLADGTLAGSIATMDQVFRTLVRGMDVSIVDAATICATTPARELALDGHGIIAPGAVADITVLDSQLTVAQTYVGGELVYDRQRI
jgi:N-acetylglucosamine-6-phosphate deacetylase